MLSVSHLRKSFGTRVAVDDVSFTIQAGETLGLLGPNGAGKTTTLAMISGLTRPDGGSVALNGQTMGSDADRLKFQVGLVPQDLALIEELSAWANLELFGGLYGLSGALLRERGAAALDLVGLASRRDDHVRTFSGGMKRRLNIAGALLHDPQLLLLDEPTVGVDPQSRNAIFENLEELKRRGKTLLYTTHYMEEAERLCDRVVIVDQGVVIADDTIRGLYQRVPGERETLIDIENPQTASSWLAGFAALPGVSTVVPTATGVRLVTRDNGASLARCLEYIAAHGENITAVQTERVNLEDVFISLTGHALRDTPAADSA